MEKKLLQGHWVFIRFLGLTFSQFQPKKEKEIGLTNFELRILNYISNIHEFLW